MMKTSSRLPIGLFLCLMVEHTEIGATAIQPQVAGCRNTTGVRWDPVLEQRWITVSSCEHPERPSTARLDQDTIASLATLPRDVRMSHRDLREPVPVVHTGDLIRLWGQEEHLRIEVTAISEESGSVGKSVHVRLIRTASGEQQAEQRFVGVVRGPASVEMSR